MKENDFLDAVKQVKVPILVLDQKWHRLFAISKKPDDVLENEARLKELLAKQGKLNTELREYKKVKGDLMAGIVVNMEGADKSASKQTEAKKLEENKRLLEEANQKIEELEDEMMELPKEIKAVNEMLMLQTMDFCYEKLRTNATEIDEISEWIKQMRIDLKKNIIRKQNREINNKEIYSYMHDIFGKDVINLFDVKYDEGMFDNNNQ